jgi:hypothetical protein
MNKYEHEIFILIISIRYAIGALFLFQGVAFLFQGEILPGIFSILIGVISTPAIADPIESKLNMSPSISLRFIVMLFLLMAIGATVPHVGIVPA